MPAGMRGRLGFWFWRENEMVHWLFFRNDKGKKWHGFSVNLEVYLHFFFWDPSPFCTIQLYRPSSVLAIKLENHINLWPSNGWNPSFFVIYSCFDRWFCWRGQQVALDPHIIGVFFSLPPYLSNLLSQIHCRQCQSNRHRSSYGQFASRPSSSFPSPILWPPFFSLPLDHPL